MAKNVYKLGKYCECCGKPVADFNRSGFCSWCQTSFSNAEYHERKRIAALTDATPDWREALRISEGVKL